MSRPRRAFTVALVGADGAGKTTVGRLLVSKLGMPACYLYMGDNRDASNHLLPTTRLIRKVKRSLGAAPATHGPPEPTEDTAGPAGARTAGWSRRARRALHLGNQLAEEWHRQILAWRHIRRGSVVVFDRHFFADYYAHDIAPQGPRPLSRRLHGLILATLYPRPNLVVVLDAPPEVLIARKGEGTLESLARRRGEYLELAGRSDSFFVVDATRPLDEVVQEVVQVVRAFPTSPRPGVPATSFRP